MDRNPQAKKDRAWQRVNAWEQTLASADRDAWRAVVDLRNDDVHEKPVVPMPTWLDDPHWGSHFPPNHWGPMFGARAARVVTHPTTGRDAEVLKLAEATLRVVRKLLDDYETL